MSPALVRRVPLLAALLALVATMLVGIAAPAQAAGLTSLTLVDTNITMRPAAAANTFINVAPAATTQTHILASFADGTAEYTVDGGTAVPLVSDDSSVAVPVHAGLTTLVVTHTAADTTVTAYTVYIKNQVLLTDIAVETNSGVKTITPTFDSATFTYTLTVPHDDTQARIKSTWPTSPDPTVSALSYSIGWGPSGGTTSGTWSNYSDLSVGSGNRWCPTLVATTAQGSTPEVGVGYANDRYCITITREDAFSASTISALSFDDSLMQTPGGTLRSTGVPFEFYAYPEWGATQTHLTATFASGSATYSVDGTPAGSLTSGVRSGAIPIHDGVNDVVVTYTAADTTVTTYTIHVLSRTLLTNMELETNSGPVTLAPTFDPLTFTYAVTVPHDDTQARIRSTWPTSPDPTVTSMSYSIGWGPSGGTTSGTWSNYMNLTVGSGNRWCPTLVTSTAVSTIPQVGVGYANDRWCITITREDAFSSAAVSAVTFDDSLMQTPGGTLRSTGVPYEFYAYPEWGATQTHVTTTFASGSATYTVDGVAAGSLTSGVRSGAIALHDGVNDVVVTHTAADTTVTTYTFHLLSRTLLTTMELESGTSSIALSPAFDPNVFTYTATVPHDDTVARIKSSWNTNPDPTVTSMNYSIGWGPSGGTTTDTWSNYASLSVGDGNRWCPTLVSSTAVSSIPQVGVGYTYDRYCITITRATAFADITSVTLPGVPAVGTPVPTGSAISVTPAGVSGSPTPTVTYDWEAADDTTFTTTTVVATTTTPSWTPPLTVADKYVRVTATADNGVSTPTSVTSSAFGPIAAVPTAPTITGASVSGTAQVGVALTATPSGVIGYPTPTETYQWESSADGSAFSAIGGATGASFTPSGAQEGEYLRVVVTASNGVGSPASATSSATAAVIAAASSGGGGGGGASPIDSGAVPSAPGDPTATPGDSSATVIWSAPSSAGDFPVTTYQVQGSPGKASCLTTELTCVVAGLENGAAYTFRVRALNGAGWSDWSEVSAPVTPVASGVDPVDPVRTVVIDSVKVAKGRVVVHGVTSGIGDGERVFVRVASYRGKDDRWAKYRTKARATVENGEFTVRLKAKSRMRVVAKVRGVDRTPPIVVVRGKVV